MADNFIPVQSPNTTDSKLDTESLTVGGNTVHRERLQISGAAALEISRVLNATPSSTDYALVVRPVGQLADNAPFVDGTTPVLPVGFIFDESVGTALTENDVAAARLNANRAVVSVLEDNTTRGNRVRALGTIPGSTDIGLVVRPVGQLADNAPFVDGTTPVLPVGFIFDESVGTALTENDIAAARVDSKRAIIFVEEDVTTRGRRGVISASGAKLVELEELPAAAALGDTTANPTTTQIGAANETYNPTTTQFERQRGNYDATLLASAARTTTTNSSDMTNVSGSGVLLILDATANPGGGETLSIKIQAKDSISNVYIDIADFGVALTAANGTKAYLMNPGVIAADFVAGSGSAKSVALPRTWRAVVTHSAAGSWTYSLSAAVLV